VVQAHLVCCCHVNYHHDVGHGHHPAVGPVLERQQHIVTNSSTKRPEAQDRNPKVAQTCNSSRVVCSIMLPFSEIWGC
jgi:hypothetical protein